MTSVILTDSRARQWVYSPDGLRAVPPSPFTFPVVAEKPVPWHVRLYRWLTEAPATTRW